MYVCMYVCMHAYVVYVCMLETNANDLPLHSYKTDMLAGNEKDWGMMTFEHETRGFGDGYGELSSSSAL